MRFLWSATATEPATARSPANGTTLSSGSATRRRTRARVDAEALLDGMLAKERLLDLVENFILFDDSRPGGTRKIVARNHQVLGREQCGGVSHAAGRTEARDSHPSERLIDTVLSRSDVTVPERSAGCRARALEATDDERSNCRSWSGRIQTSAGLACSGTRKAAESPTRWLSSPRRCAA